MQQQPQRPGKDRCQPTKVRFHDIEVIEFPSIVGDNPSVSMGAPLALAPVHRTRTVVTVDEYEMYRGQRLVLMQLVLNEAQREKRLRSLGYGAEDISKAIRLVQQCRSQRHNSCLAMPWDGFYEKWEKTSHKVQKIVGLRKSTKIMWPTIDQLKSTTATSKKSAIVAAPRYPGIAARIAPADE